MDEETELPQEMDDAAGGVGALLRASRIRRGEELSDISSTLRIRHVYMEAIEEDRFDDLPGLVYAIGFVRGYADYLGLDGEEVVRRFKEQANAVEKPRDLTFPSFIPEHGLPRGALLMVALIVAVLGYGGWYFVSTKDRFATEVVAPVPERLAPEVGETTAPAGSNDAAQSAAVADTSSNALSEEESTTAAPAPTTDTSEAATALSEASTVPESTASSANEASTETATEAAPTAVTAEAAADNVAATVEDSTAVAQNADTPTTTTTSESTVAPTSTPTTPTETTPTVAVPVEAATPSETPASSAAVEAPDPSQIPQDSTGPAPTVAEPAQTAAVPVPTQPESTATPPTPSASTESRIIVRAKLASWVQVRDEAANQLVLTRLLQAGDTYLVPNQPGLVLMTGNAGALEITVDGGTVPSIGEVGTVRRHVALEPERLKSGTAVVE